MLARPDQRHQPGTGATTCRPKQHLEAIGKRYPHAWRAIDRFRAERGQSVANWPDWCFAPMAASAAVVTRGEARRVTLSLITDAAHVAALAAWRVGQGVYRFDPAVYEAVRSTPLAGNLPCEVLYRLPEWCVYVETPEMTLSGNVLHGFFAHLEWDANNGREELRLLLDTDLMLLPIALHLGAWTLDEAVGRSIRIGLRYAQDTRPAENEVLPATRLLARGVEPMVSLLLYLCAQNAEIGDGKRRPERPRPKRTKHGERLFPPDRPANWEVGVRLGAALRSARNGNVAAIGQAHQSPRPHLRRAHWHTYRVGRGGSATLLKWLPPIPVNVLDPNELPATVREVSGIAQR